MAHGLSESNRLRLYSSLLKLTIEQEKFLKNDDFVNMMLVIEKKQEVIEKIDKIKKSDDSETFLEDINKIIEIVSEQQKIENRIESLLNKKLSELRSKMALVQKEKRVAESYKGQTEEVSKFFDKRR